MNKAILKEINAFDKTLGTTISFTCDEQPYGSKLKIYSYDGTTVVLETSIIETMKLSYALSSDISKALENGTQYQMRIIVYGEKVDGVLTDASEESDPKFFWCHSSPEFGLSIGDTETAVTVRNSSITLQASYSQEEDTGKETELLDIYYIEFYDENKNKISDSGEKYGSNITTDAFSVNGLVNKTTYYFRGIGTTVHGMSVDTGYVCIRTFFKSQQSSIMIRLENEQCKGQIKCSSYINMNKYKLDHEAIYEDDTYIDLTDNELTYYETLRIGTDYSMYSVVKEITPGTIFLCLESDDANNIYFRYLIHNVYGLSTDTGKFEVVGYRPYFSVEVNEKEQVYVTDFFDQVTNLSDLDDVVYIIKFAKKNNLFRIEITQKEG